MLGGIHHLALRSNRIADLHTFYTSVLGLKTLRAFDNGQYWLAAGDTVLMLETRSAAEPAFDQTSMELIAFRIEPSALSAMRARLANANVAVEAETAFTLYVRDPDGRRIGISTYDFSFFLAVGANRNT
jgi:glyoxylase I family protein